MVVGATIIGDIVLVIVHLVGNNYFGHESVRRGEVTPPFTQLYVTGAAPPDSDGNVLRGMITEESIDKYSAR